LKRALAGQDAGRLASLRPELAVDSQALPGNRDGNTVNLEHELVELSQNSLQHAVESQLVSASLLKLRLAITGKSA
jgi:flagellar basal body rod protein FlgB